jgi:hypothetical protein
VHSVTKKLLCIASRSGELSAILHFPLIFSLVNDKIMLEVILQQKDLHTVPLVCCSLKDFYPTYFLYTYLEIL